ncbi:hypothetical protein N9051_01275 [Akkermansiaceae bacterium]|nr:hypothetical protein [Akkermansiaceae bacterium]
MELEKVTAEIRPRSEWEAVDLGLSLARVHLGTLWNAWLVTVLPLCALILGLFYESPGWGVFLIWWLKPIWDRVALFPLSRNLFGEKPDTKATIRVVPEQMQENWVLVLMGIIFAVSGALVHHDGNVGVITLYWLSLIVCLFYRSSIYRSLVLPVHFLEGLRKSRYRSRVDLLSRRCSGTAFGLTLICLIMEVGFFMSLFYFAEFMIPAGVDWAVTDVLSEFFDVGSDAFPKWLMMMVGLAYVISMSITSWFYAGAGFGLYVNSRTWTEGWDIELAFKRLGQRLGIVILALAFFSMTPELHAESSQERMEQVLSDEAFDEKSYTKRTKVEEVEDEEEDYSSSIDWDGVGMFAQVGQLIFWIVVIAAVGGIIWLIVQNSQAFGVGGASDEEDRNKVKTLAGMNIAPETLPDDVPTEARKLWDAGQKREALALLYRGAISSLVSRDLVEIEESDTEMDCLRRLREKPVGESGYFENLTQLWIGIAYAKVTPEESQAVQLWSTWPFPRITSKERRSS